jgi:uncharacterized linocin/CFP29 family protein
VTDHLLRGLAPVGDVAWERIEQEAKGRLVTHLAARKLVDFTGPHGWGHSATNLGRAVAVGGPAQAVSARRRQVLPLVELCAEFAVSRLEVADAERGATDLDLPEVGEAARQMALAENVSVFHGYAEGGVRGITEASSHEPLSIGEDVAQYPKVVARASDVLRRAGIEGPYGLALSPELYTRIVETAEHGGYLLFDHLRQILGGPLVWAPGLAGGVVVSLRGGDFVFDCGQDLSIGYLSHDAEVVRFFLEESFSFRVLEPDAAVALRLVA